MTERVAYLAKSYLKKAVPNYKDVNFSMKQFATAYPEMARQLADETVEPGFKFQTDCKMKDTVEIRTSTKRFDGGLSSCGYHSESTANQSLPNTV